MAGGQGTRIRSVVSGIPKPMIPINGIPILEHEIISLRNQGFKDLIITVSYLGDAIMNYFGNGEKWGVRIEYYNEKKPLGNAGALFKIKDKLNTDFLLLNGDCLFDIDFNRFIKFHKSHKSLATIFTHPNDHPYDSGLIIANTDGSVRNWLGEEETRPEFYHNRVNAGLHIISPRVLDIIDGSEVGKVNENGEIVKIDLDRQILKPLVRTGKIFCYDSPEYVKDMGTPQRLNQVRKDFESGKVKEKNLLNRQRAVFLDRDGTINVYKGFLRDANEFELIDGVAEAIREINLSGYLCVVITNQPVIARGEVTWNELEEIHKKMETLLGRKGAYLDGIYFCPHHPHSGFKGEIEALKFDCDCRKPKPGLLLKASEDINIDLTKSWMIGDSGNDVKAGKAAGCKTVLVKKDSSKNSLEDYGQDHTFESLNQFVDWFLSLEDY